MVCVRQLVIFKVLLALFYILKLCRGSNQGPVLRNDAEACISCTVVPLSSSTLHSGPIVIKFGENIQIDPALILSDGYFVSCGIGVTSPQDSETSIMEGVFALSSTQSIAPVYYISHYLKSATRVLSGELNTDQILNALHSKEL